MVQMVGGDSTVCGAVKSGDIESSSPATLANSSGSNKKSATKGRGGRKTTKKADKAVTDSSKKSSANSKKSSKSSSKGGKKKATPKGSGKTPSSPDEPPRIQHSFSQNTKRGNDPFYFDVSRSGAFFNSDVRLRLVLRLLRLLRLLCPQQNSFSLFDFHQHSLHFSHISRCEHQVERLLCSIIKGP